MDALRILSRSTSLKTQKPKEASQHLPSEGQAFSQESSKGIKRKFEDDDEQELNNEQIRALHKQHKIRVINLRKLHKHRTTKTHKQQKESARVFPQPLLRFAQLRPRHHVSRAIQENIAAQGYYEPTEIQIAALPLLLEDVDSGPDILSVAPTGSGKTLAFLTPAIEKARKYHKSQEGSDRHTRALVLAPTKELVGQIVNEGRKLCTQTGVTITAMRKGLKLTDSGQEASGSELMSESDTDDRRATRPTPIVKSDIVVSTPLSLVHALGSSTLPHITNLILDEADVLLDPLFREQTLLVWLACNSVKLQVSLWSATIGSNIEELAISTIAARRKSLGSKLRPPLYRIIIGLKDSSLPSITHKLVYAATEPGKLLGLRQLLHPARSQSQTSKSTASQPPQLRPPFIVFTQTIDRASALHDELQYDIAAAAGGSSRIAVLHSSLSSTARSTIMTKFRKGEIWILITTDLLSRGVDFRGVNGVVNYDIPTTSAAYVHRAGRTGRAGRAGGVCVTFYTKEDIKYLKAIASVINSSQSNQSNADGTEGGGPTVEGIDPWLLASLPDLSKRNRKELKVRGVETRRAIKESDNAEERKKKRKARIGTKSGYEKKIENRRKGAVQGSKQRKGDRNAQEEDGFQGFD